MTATATAGPSGVAIACSVDGSPYQWHLGASEGIPVQGVGQHVVTCWAQNSAVDVYGHPAVSQLESWHIAIRVPTIASAWFTKRVDKLRCRRETERVRIPGHWVKVRRHGKVVRVHRPARWVKKRVVRCHPRLVRRRVRVHGHWRTVLVPVFPHLVQRTVRRVAFGQATTVSGWLGAKNGVALGGQVVHVLTAPDNGSNRFAQAAVVRTRPDGGWSARLAPGPGRLIEVLYAGSPTTEPTLSGPARLVVPAKVKLISVSPGRVAWGGTVRITGQLVGGYLPPGGALVRLRIGLGSRYQTYGVKEHVTGNGRFTTTYTFGRGPARILRRFWFQIATLPMGNYPYAPAASGRLYVLVGGHPHRQEETASMIAPRRGDERIHSRWRPGAGATTPPPRGTQGERPGKGPSDGLQALDRPGTRRRLLWGLTATVVLIVVAVIGSRRHVRESAGASLPSTPQQWVEQWMAASLDDPGRVCRQLFAPALAAAFKADTGRSCLSYYNDVSARSFRIRHVLVDGDAAAVEVREVGMRPNWGYVTMLLGHVDQGWRAIDIVPGGPVRPR